jgi:hypothetical protein
MLHLTNQILHQALNLPRILFQSDTSGKKTAQLQGKETLKGTAIVKNKNNNSQRKINR